jgi:hypothetical protein
MPEILRPWIGGKFVDGNSSVNDYCSPIDGSPFWSSCESDRRIADLTISEARDNYPFGGTKASGYGREGVRYAIDEMSQWKFLGISLVEQA